MDVLNTTFREESDQLHAQRRLSTSNPNLGAEVIEKSLEDPKIPQHLTNMATALKLMQLEDEMKAIQAENNSLRAENETLRSELQMVKSMRKRKNKTVTVTEVADVACDTKDLQKEISKNKNPLLGKKHTIKIVAASQGRGLAQIINDDQSFKVTASVVPNGKMNDVLKCADCSSDVLVVFAGGNDVRNGDPKRPAHHLNDFLMKNSLSQLIVLGIPHRHNEVPRNVTDLPVQRANAKLKELCSRFPNTVFIDVTDVPRSSFTSHGLHLNQRGKKQIADKIASALMMSNSSHPQPAENQQHQHDSPKV